MNSSGSTISASQASPVLPEVIANGRATMKNAVLITVKPNPITRIGTSITIAIASGRSSGIAAEACPVTNARKRQLIVKIFRDFVRYMFTGMYKYIAGQRLNSPMTGAWSEGRSCSRAVKSIMHARHEEVKTEFASI